MPEWIRKNIALVLIMVAFVGWGALSVGSRMAATNATPPGYVYHCFDSGDLASNCMYLADPSTITGWATDPGMHLELIHYRSGRRSTIDASVIVWSGSDPAPCGFKRSCFIADTDKTECHVMKVFDAACR